MRDCGLGIFSQSAASMSIFCLNWPIMAHLLSGCEVDVAGDLEEGQE
ncbi:uncharacterized, partial [Tachysurus ichikawai]